jgi:ATP-dependent DNA helicase RecG
MVPDSRPVQLPAGDNLVRAVNSAPPTSSPPATPLQQPVTILRGVGSERAGGLAKLEIHTVEDLLLHRPRRYEDRQRFRPIAELRLEEPALTRGTIVAMGVKWFRQREKSIFEIILDDGTARLYCRWWNLPFMEKYFARGDEVIVYGKPLQLKPRTIDHPETEVVEAGEESFIHLDRITPVYPLTEGLSQRWLRALIWRALIEYGPRVAEPWPDLGIDSLPSAAFGTEAGGASDPPPPPLARASRLQSPPFLSRAAAIRALHFPAEPGDAEAARRRLALEEFVDLQLRMRWRRKRFEARAAAKPCGGDNRLVRPFLARLGFQLTKAQTTVLRGLRRDLAGSPPMRRLLQGDVGSGKTVVAACCALMAIESGYHVALMAPTEILAEQHFLNFSRWFQPLGIPVELHTGSRKPGKKRGGTGGGEGAVSLRHPSLFIGTHALIQSGFNPGNLGLVIIDEQHRFGVEQREELVRKGDYPHLLVMTATPIPRTLGLTVYGELDLSVIDQMPPGRGRLRTFVRGSDKLPQVWAFIRGKLAEGRQAYVVYPRVEETGRSSLKAVARELENVRRELAPFQVGLLHGRLKGEEKERTMAEFRANRVQVLLATTLVEVGVDVPNATLMLIEDAEQFGLAQLHQLRGRIGRGGHDSYCILLASATTGEAHQRLEALEKSNDGFQIAEADLTLRGPGELLGRQQSGAPKLRFGDFARDLEIVLHARRIAARLVDAAWDSEKAGG